MHLEIPLPEAFISLLLRSDLEDELEDCEARRGTKFKLVGLLWAKRVSAKTNSVVLPMVLPIGFLRWFFICVYDYGFE